MGEELELICFEIISSVGAARSSFIEAIQAVKSGNRQEAERLMEDGKEMLKAGHGSHGKLIQKEAAGEKTELSLILVHAEDQMMSAEILEIMAREYIELYKMLQEKNKCNMEP
ncbi:MAG: PTS lactose/cellobiose transporter subunit IIA [Clostridiales bacterium]|nr:PTS lactose/cellobiose transporter subunit IIA [Clostridiales bacterium]